MALEDDRQERHSNKTVVGMLLLASGCGGAPGAADGAGRGGRHCSACAAEGSAAVNFARHRLMDIVCEWTLSA